MKQPMLIQLPRHQLLVGIVLLASALLPICLGAETVDPANDGSQYAWSENAGWVSAEPLGDGGPGMHLAVGSVRGWLWSQNLGWISLTCENTASCGTVTYGVELDEGGNLSGYAWSENVGWVSFSCLTSGSCLTVDYGVIVDPVDGELSGFAWSENVGWVSFSCGNTASCATVEYGVRTATEFPAHIFSDGFESGNTSAWSSSTP